MQMKDKIAFDADIAARAVPALRHAFSDQNIDLQDGVRIDWFDRWVHVRPSNTEPLLRLNVEARADDQMASLRDEVLAMMRTGA